MDGEGVAMGPSDLLLFPSSSLSGSYSLSSAVPRPPTRKAVLGEVRSLIDKGAVELAPPSPGFCSRLFVVWKTSGS